MKQDRANDSALKQETILSFEICPQIITCKYGAWLRNAIGQQAVLHSRKQAGDSSTPLRSTTFVKKQKNKKTHS